MSVPGPLSHEKGSGSDGNRLSGISGLKEKVEKIFCTDPRVGVSVCLSAATWPRMDLCMPIYRRGSDGKESACHCRKHRIDPWSRKIPTCGRATKPMTTTTEHVL